MYALITKAVKPSIRQLKVSPSARCAVADLLPIPPRLAILPLAIHFKKRGPS